MDDINYIKVINREVITNTIEYVSACERHYHAVLSQIVKEILAKPGDTKIIMLAGPSSSGKTTGANKLARLVSQSGFAANVISLDDFYINREDIPVGKDGKRDFEAVYALDIELIQNTLKNLIEKGETKLPYFDFVTGTRKDNVFDLKLNRGDVVIIEGLHAINPIFTMELGQDCDSIYKIYVSVASDIYDDNGQILFDRTDIRLIRRMIRDNLFRGTPVPQTLDMWEKVIDGEIKYLQPLIPTADYVIDSLHPYELCIYRNIALKALKEIEEDNKYYSQAQTLIEKFNKVTMIDKDIIPKNSLLREFVG